jgi:hypothetical protein
MLVFIVKLRVFDLREVVCNFFVIVLRTITKKLGEGIAGNVIKLSSVRSSVFVAIFSPAALDSVRSPVFVAILPS